MPDRNLKICVSSTDLYIILKLSGISSDKLINNSRYHDSILPPSLGGGAQREVAVSFGSNYKSIHTVEMIKRYSKDSGVYASASVKGLPLSPIEILSAQLHELLDIS